MFAISAVGLVVNQIVLYLAVGVFHMHLVLSKMAATAAVFGWNYTARSRWVFRRSAP